MDALRHDGKRGQPEASDRRMQGFERLLTLWVLLCMLAGIALGRLAPGLARPGSTA